MGRSEKRTKKKPQKMRRAISSLAWGIQKKSSEYRGFDLLDEGGCMDEFDIEHTVYCSSI